MRSVVFAVTETFKKGFEMGRFCAFDEMVIPSRSSFNRVRVFLQNKPHKYDTKLYALCDSKTSYCKRYVNPPSHQCGGGNFVLLYNSYPCECNLPWSLIPDRLEVYCGTRQDRRVVDTAGGPVAVVRNLQQVWPTTDKRKRRCIVTDREYTSPALALRLRKMGYDLLGTCSKDRFGLPSMLKVATKNRPASMPRGTYVVARHEVEPNMYAVRWADNKQVYFLSTGIGCTRTSVIRKLKSGDKEQVPCPEVVAAYNQTMAGVDSHDQLRLQRYLIQRGKSKLSYPCWACLTDTVIPD